MASNSAVKSDCACAQNGANTCFNFDIVKPRVLIIADKDDYECIDRSANTDHWIITWKLTDYGKMYKKIDEIRQLAARNHVDFLLFSRNDQVANRVSIGQMTKLLRIGYSSFSGIDKARHTEQLQKCFADFIKCNNKLGFKIHVATHDSIPRSCRGTFSIIFDVEQLGDVRYALPRILKLLKYYNVKATFFVTNILKRVYPNVLGIIQGEGHEVGIHGLWHEYLSNHTLERQSEYMRAMKMGFGGKVEGANFIGRMNLDTLEALAKNEIKYFIHIRNSHFLGFREYFLMPTQVQLSQGNVWMLPVSVSTYNLPWLHVKNAVDCALAQCAIRRFYHISILCHPFRDGTLTRIKDTDRLINYLCNSCKLRSITLRELVNGFPSNSSVFPKIDKELVLRSSSRIPLPLTKHDFLNIVPDKLTSIWRRFNQPKAVG